MALGLLLVASLLVRSLWLTLPSGSLIFDEVYYVNAARTILGLAVPSDAPYAGAPPFLDPNTEHPPLGKVLMAGSMAVFGDDPIGWRLPSLIAGIVALAAVYLIVRRLGGSPWLGVLAVSIYSLDVLSFIHGRVGTLDMLSLALVLVGAWLAIARRPAAAGAAIALGTLVKITGLLGLVAVVAWEALALWPSLRGRQLGWRDLRPVIVLVGAFLVVGVGGLWLLDARFTAFATPLDHIARIFGYGFALQNRYSPNSVTSAPWEWLAGGGQFDYLKTAVNTLANGETISSRAIVEFRAALNPVLIGSVTLLLGFAAWLAWRRGDALARWGLIWFAASYLPYLPLAVISNRAMYLYYMLPAVPALAVLAAIFLVRSGLPRALTWVYLAGMAIAFLAYFPFRQPP